MIASVSSLLLHPTPVGPRFIQWWKSDFALAVLVRLPVLQVNDSGELISGQYRHFGA